MINNFNNDGALRLKAGEKLSTAVKERLDALNKAYSKTRDFNAYLTGMETLFTVPSEPVTAESQGWLGGFLEGEASVNVSAKKHANAKFGLLIDPEFSITQHVNGMSSLLRALRTFRTGRIRYKSGSNATMVFIIDNRASLEEKVLPFYEKWGNQFSSPTKVERFHNFKQVLRLFREDGHSKLHVLVNELLPIWDSMRMQKGQSNETFADLKEAQDYAVEFTRNKTKM